MELKQYWNVIWKRRWLVLAIVVLAVLISAVMFLRTPKTYKAEMRFITRQLPTPDLPGSPGMTGTLGTEIFTFNRYYNWYASEFLVDDYTIIATSDAFANTVLDTMRKDLDAGQLKANDPAKLRADIDKLNYLDISKANEIDADRKNRELRLTITSGSPDMTRAIADASAQVLTQNLLKPLSGTLVNDQASFSQIDAATQDTIQSSTSRDVISAAVRVIIGLVVALALAFLLEYLDNSVRDEQDARRVLDMPVIGAIPRS